MEETSSGNEIQQREVYILRLWRESDGKNWHGQIQNIHSGQISLVRNEDELCAYLRGEAGSEVPHEERRGLK